MYKLIQWDRHKSLNDYTVNLTRHFRLDFVIIISIIIRLNDLYFVRVTLLMYTGRILDRNWLPFDDPFVYLGGDPHQDRVTHRSRRDHVMITRITFCV
jgi:hypothetical protein